MAEGRVRRTQAERRASTRRALLESGRRVFGAKGLDGSSIEEISADAGVSRGAFYAYFRSKDELFVALLDDMIGEVSDVTEELIGIDPTPAALVAALADRQIGHSRAEPSWQLLLAEFRVQASRNHEVGQRLSDYYLRLRADLAALIESEFDALDASAPLAPDLLAAALIALDEGLTLQQLATPNTVPPNLMLDLVGLVLEASANRHQHLRRDAQDPT